VAGILSTIEIFRHLTCKDELSVLVHHAIPSWKAVISDWTEVRIYRQQ
jgi:hypothetical protein